MLLALYFLIVRVVLPQLGSYALALLEPAIVIVIALAGIVLLFGAVGMKISNNLGSTIVGGLFKGLGYLCRTLFQAFGWIITNTFRMIPRVFNRSRSVLINQMNLNTSISNVLATIIVIIFVAVII